MTTYPAVLGEFDTLAAVVGGKSIARYGDGEFKMAAHDAAIKCQQADKRLSARLREILINAGQCLVGIPNIKDCIEKNPNLDKVEFWIKQRRFYALLADRPYVSSFITRPDSAPWIDAPEYWTLLESLWVGLDITLVRGSGRSFTAERLLAAGAKSVREIQAPPQNAWADYASLLQRIGTPERALLCLGPTATVMAVDLCAKGVHAIDIGHAGMFWKKHAEGLPMWMAKDKKTGAAA